MDILPTALRSCVRCGQAIRKGEETELKTPTLISPRRWAMGFIHSQVEYCDKALQRHAGPREWSRRRISDSSL
jgi:hypothetical protein